MPGRGYQVCLGRTLSRGEGKLIWLENGEKEAISSSLYYLGFLEEYQVVWNFIHPCSVLGNKKVRFSRVAEVREMSAREALHANLARLSYAASLRAATALRRAANR